MPLFTEGVIVFLMSYQYCFFNKGTPFDNQVFDVMPAVRVKQVHSNKVVTVNAPLTEWVEADAVVTRMQNIPIGVITADCAPVVLIADGVVGVAHAGWQGALNGILENTVSEMEVAPADIVAYIGPCIAQKSYEVSEGFERPFLERDDEAERFFMAGAKDGKLQFDLSGYCAFRLSQCGVRNVKIDGTDTLTDAEYHSHRGGAGSVDRNLSAVMINS